MFELSDKDYHRIKDIIYNVIGINLGDSKKELLRTRLSKRLRALSIDTFDEYYNHVTKRDQSELTHLFDAISTNTTSFFREMEHFKFVTSTVLPALIEEKKKKNDREIRIWSAASSTGEEAYSIAMTVLEFLRPQLGWNVKILATDISTKVIAKVEAGIYTEDRVSTVPKEMLRKYFRKGRGELAGMVKLKDEVKNMVYPRRINLQVAQFPFKKEFDFIFCRNVMIYFDKETQLAIVDKLYRHLKKGGYLFLGHAESLTGIQTQFRYVKPTVYIK
ncbi:MAG: protein-glutamate O-methyltransferase CheR [Proteobacteria bacterium]|nr:protein-glutamate O-methyltransferase CheR [Pseudomonadota bacterium]